MRTLKFGSFVDRVHVDVGRMRPPSTNSTWSTSIVKHQLHAGVEAVKVEHQPRAAVVDLGGRHLKAVVRDDC